MLSLQLCSRLNCPFVALPVFVSLPGALTHQRSLLCLKQPNAVAHQVFQLAALGAMTIRTRGAHCILTLHLCAGPHVHTKRDDKHGTSMLAAAMPLGLQAHLQREPTQSLEPVAASGNFRSRAGTTTTCLHTHARACRGPCGEAARASTLSTPQASMYAPDTFVNTCMDTYLDRMSQHSRMGLLVVYISNPDRF